MAQETGLLDLLHKMVGCEYLSSMKERHWRRKLLQTINEIDAAEYSYEQWSKALSYLFGRDIPISSAEGLRAFAEAELAKVREQIGE